MQQTYTGWDPVIGIKTSNGFWQMGAYSSDTIHFGYMAGAFGGHATNSFDQSFQFRSNGNFVASGDVTAYSDERLKTNICTIEDSLNKVLKLRGVEFDKGGQRQIGVIAQEVEKVIPEVVHQNDEYKSVAYGNIVGLLIEAIKEQDEKIARLEALVEKLAGN